MELFGQGVNTVQVLIHSCHAACREVLPFPAQSENLSVVTAFKSGGSMSLVTHLSVSELPTHSTLGEPPLEGLLKPPNRLQMFSPLYFLSVYGVFY